MKRMIKGAVIGTALFGSTFASASALTTGSGSQYYSQPFAQQSADLTSSCTNGATQIGYIMNPGATVAYKAIVKSQTIQGCLGMKFELAVGLGTSPTAITSTAIFSIRYTDTGIDAVIALGAGLRISDIQTTRLTIISDIHAAAPVT
jgi:hypothetical protein